MLLGANVLNLIPTYCLPLSSSAACDLPCLIWEKIINFYCSCCFRFNGKSYQNFRQFSTICLLNLHVCRSEQPTWIKADWNRPGLQNVKQYSFSTWLLSLNAVYVKLDEIPSTLGLLVCNETTGMPFGAQQYIRETSANLDRRGVRRTHQRQHSLVRTQ